VVSVHPYDFSRIPKVSREEARLINSLYRFLPPTQFSEGLHNSLSTLLTKEIGEDFSFRLERIFSSEVSPYLETLPKQGVYLILGMAPHEEKGILEIDLMFAHSLIDRLLGGEGEPLTALRPLTEIEQGVLTYILLKVISHFYEECGGTAGVHFRLEDHRSSPTELIPSLKGARPDGAKRFVILSWQASLGKGSGYFRLLLPAPFVERLRPIHSGDEAEYNEKRFQELGFLKTDLWAELGRTTLKNSELTSLKAGDILLLDQTEARFAEGGLSGHLTLRLGSGERSAFRARLTGLSKKLQVKMEDLFEGEP